MTVIGYSIMLMLTSNANIIFVDVMCFSSSYTAQIDLHIFTIAISIFEEQELWFYWICFDFVSELTKGEFVSVFFLIVIFLDNVIIV